MDGIRFEKSRPDDGIHEYVESNGYGRSANITALVIIASALAVTVIGVTGMLLILN